MKTIRQIYIYLTALVSLEVVVWGVIRLARTLANPSLALDAIELAGALALLVVGVPIFWFHWRMAQRQAGQEEEERFSLVRALFLYSALLVTFIPLVQNSLALINRLLLEVFQQPASRAVFGGEQIWSDNAIAVFVNALIGTYIFTAAWKDWSLGPANDHLRNIRRAARHIFLVYGLALTVGGVHEIIRYLLGAANTVGETPLGWLANGLALLVIGVPLWLIVRGIIQRSLEEHTEQTAALRQVVLFLLSLVSAVGTLVSAGFILHILLTLVLGERRGWTALLAELAQPAGFAVPLAGIWTYYGRAFRQTFSMEAIFGRSRTFRKLYNYLLAGLGIAAVVIGLQTLLTVLIDLGLRSAFLGGPAVRNRLSGSLAGLAVGLPTWLIPWGRLDADIKRKDASGDRAERSLIRKAYLYLMLFAGIIGGMVSGGRTAFILFKGLLGEPVPDLAVEALAQFSLLLIFSGLFAYHLVIHRRDLRREEQALAALHARYPVLILDHDEGDFATWLTEALQREAPTLPVTLQVPGEALPPADETEARAVILSARLAVDPTPALRKFLEGFSGQRLVVPVESGDWHWVYGSGRPSASLASRTARLVRELAEGEGLPAGPENSPLRTVLMVFGVLFSLQLLFSLVAFLISTIFV